jgi:D-lactate dehydrogenase
MGTGKIGQILCNIIKGFGANIICYDVFESDEVKALGGKYVSKDEIFAQSDILFLMSKLIHPLRQFTILYFIQYYLC